MGNISSSSIPFAYQKVYCFHDCRNMPCADHKPNVQAEHYALCGNLLEL